MNSTRLHLALAIVVIVLIAVLADLRASTAQDAMPILITSDCTEAHVTAGDGFYPGPTRIERDEHGCVVTARVFHVFRYTARVPVVMR